MGEVQDVKSRLGKTFQSKVNVIRNIPLSHNPCKNYFGLSYTSKTPFQEVYTSELFRWTKIWTVRRINEIKRIIEPIKLHDSMRLNRVRGRKVIKKEAQMGPKTFISTKALHEKEHNFSFIVSMG